MGNKEPPAESKSLPLHACESEQKQDAEALGTQVEVSGDRSESFAEAGGPQAPSEQHAAAEPEIVSGQGFSTTHAEQAKRFHASVKIPADLEMKGPPMDIESSSKSGAGEDAEQYFAGPEEELSKPLALINDWNEVVA